MAPHGLQRLRVGARGLSRQARQLRGAARSADSPHQAHEVNIYDIPIALITEQYLEYLELMQELNLDVAGEFLVMAATLIHIKSRHADSAADPDRARRGEEERIRARRWCAGCSSTRSSRPRPSCCTSVRRCGARSGTGRSGRGRRGRRRLRARARSGSVQPAGGVPRRARAGQGRGRTCCCRPSRCRSSSASSSCSSGCRRPRPSASRSCLRTSTRARRLIVTFLALLEMIRLKLIRVFQAGSFGPIRVYKRARPQTRRIRSWIPKRMYEAQHHPHGRAE